MLAAGKVQSLLRESVDIFQFSHQISGKGTGIILVDQFHGCDRCFYFVYPLFYVFFIFLSFPLYPAYSLQHRLFRHFHELIKYLIIGSFRHFHDFRQQIPLF